MNNKKSYTSADTLPVKLIQNPDVLKSIQENGYIPPVHAQVILTNKCNLNCNFCSCSMDDRETEMSLTMVLELIGILKECGTKAVTITGGGEPLLHPYFSGIVTAFNDAGIKVGLVTNGLLLPKVQAQILNKITWIRISHSSDRPFSGEYQTLLSNTVKLGHSVDWAFSYVATKNTTAEDVIPVIRFADILEFTHVRLVADLFHPKEVDMRLLESSIKKNIDDSIVIYQPRQFPEKGSSNCLIGLLKPLIDASGMVYACCGVQYALKEPSRRLPFELCLGIASKLKLITRDSLPLNGSICERCYYGGYNRTLQSMISFSDNINHKDFV